MGLFNHFPYTNFHELNIDWLLGKVKTLEEKTSELEFIANSLDAIPVVFQNNNGTYSKIAGPTASEIHTAIQNGKTIVGILNSASSPYTKEFACEVESSSSMGRTQVIFTFPTIITTPIMSEEVQTTYDRKLTLVTSLPRDTVTYSENTAVLQVVEEDTEE